MKASIVDLRYKMSDIIKALERNETVTVLYHGKEKGVIVPAEKKIENEIKSHPFFNMSPKEQQKPVLEELEELRKPRYDDI